MISNRIEIFPIYNWIESLQAAKPDTQIFTSGLIFLSTTAIVKNSFAPPTIGFFPHLCVSTYLVESFNIQIASALLNSLNFHVADRDRCADCDSVQLPHAAFCRGEPPFHWLVQSSNLPSICRSKVTEASPSRKLVHIIPCRYLFTFLQTCLISFPFFAATKLLGFLENLTILLLCTMILILKYQSLFS